MVSNFFPWNMETLSGILSVTLHTNMFLVLVLRIMYNNQNHKKHNGYSELHATRFKVFIVFPEKSSP